MVLLFANAATLTSALIDQGVEALRHHPHYDSAVSVSCYNMWSPLRARTIGDDGLLRPFVPFETFGDPATLNCDRDSQGDVWFADMGLSVVRPRCLEELHAGLLPQKWMGQKIYPLKQWGGLESQVIYWPSYGDGPFPDLSCFESGFVTMVNPCAIKGISIFLQVARQMSAFQFGVLPGWGTTSEDRRATGGSTP